MSSVTTIEELELSVRAYNCLKRAGINTLNEIVSRMETNFTSLMAVRNLGRKALEETLINLKKRGIPCDIYLKHYMASLSTDGAKSWVGFYQTLESTQPENDDLLDIDLDLLDVELNSEIDEVINAQRIGDFDALDCSEELHTLGLHSANDFPENATVSELGKQIDDWYRSCKLSAEACDELVAFLKEKGYIVDCDNSITPELDLLPHDFLHPERTDDLEHQQIRNYFRTVFSIKKDFELPTVATPSNEDDMYFEDGCYYVGEEGSCDRYEGQSTGHITTADAYPYKLLNDILGHIAALKFYRLELMPEAVTEMINSVLDTLTAHEKKCIQLRYRFGARTTLAVLGLPEWPTLLWGSRDAPIIRRGIRKLRHPSRSKIILRSLNHHPLSPTEYHRNIYSEFVDGIVNKARTIGRAGATLRETFSSFYSEDIIIRLEENQNKWMSIQPIAVEDLDLPWDVYSPLAQAGIKTLQDLWNKHQKSIPLGDFQHSGLRHVYGLHKKELTMLFEIMEHYRLELFDPQYAKAVVDYAEALACGISGSTTSANDSVLPDFACAAVPTFICAYLLQAGYRKRADVIRDYYSNNLQEQFFASGENAFTWGQLEEVAYSLATGRFQTRIFFDANRWNSVFERNPDVSFHDLRQRYLLGQHISGNPAMIEESIGLLFPAPNVSFTLINRTRKRELHWVVWPSVLLEKSALLTGKLDEAFFGTNGRTNTENYLLIKYEDKKQFDLYQFSNLSGQYAPRLCALHELELMAYEITMNLYRSVRLNAELFSDPRFGYSLLFGQTLKDQVADLYETAQKEFCYSYITQNNDSQMTKWFAAYTPKPLSSMLWRWFRLDGAGPETPIEDLELTHRCYQCLKRSGYETLFDLISLHLGDYRKLKSLGQKDLMELEGKLEALGYTREEEL